MPRFRPLSLLAILGVLVLPACGTPQSNRPVNVDVTLKEFTVEASLTNFRTGVPYHFTVTNAGQIPHEFMIIPVVKGGEHAHGGTPGASMDEQHKMALVSIPEQDLPAGATVEVNYTFQSTPEGDNIEIVCVLPGHFEAGMHIPVTIDNP